MSGSSRLLRPDDMLALNIETINLTLDNDPKRGPALVVDKAGRAAFIVFAFPPQSIAEGAYYEAAVVEPDLKSGATDPDQPHPAPAKDQLIDPPVLPGHVASGQKVVAELAHPSRLVFRVDGTTRIPFTFAGLLDWAALSLNVNPIAAIGPSPTADPIAAAPDIHKPSQTETAIELPYRLILSPGATVAWDHRTQPSFHEGRCELWHTRIFGQSAAGPFEPSLASPLPLRAIWSDDFDAANPLAPAKSDPDLDRTAMSPNDRSQIVVLTSAFHGYQADYDLLRIVTASAPAAHALVDAGAAAAAPAPPAAELLRVSPSASLFPRPWPSTRTYVPEPFFAEQLFLSPLGGWLKSRGHWDPLPRKAPPILKKRPEVGDLVAQLGAIIARAPGHDQTCRSEAIRSSWPLPSSLEVDSSKLLRTLGLVFDLRLPRAFVVESPFGKSGTLSIQGTNFDWQTATTTPELGTAYIHQPIGPTLRLFIPAPRSVADAGAPTSVVGLLNLDPQRFGVAQVDLDGALHKAIMLADSVVSPEPASNLDPNVSPAQAPHPEVFDPGATLPSLRSGGFSLYADGAGAALLDTLSQSKAFNQALEASKAQPRPFYAEDLVRGYRLDVWDAHANQWHSLHRRSGRYVIGKDTFHTKDEEGFIQLAATQPAPGATPADKDLYLHEVFARWAGWSLSVSRPGKALSRFADPDKAIPQDGDPDYATDEAVTPFKMKVRYHVVPGSLPPLRFGRRYRFRARAVDLAGNSLELGDAFGDFAAAFWGLPQDPEGFAYLRYEPVGAPLSFCATPRPSPSPAPRSTAWSSERSTTCPTRTPWRPTRTRPSATFCPRAPPWS